VDSSFLVSSYISDVNSLESDRRRSGEPNIWITQLNRSEFAHATYRQVLRGTMNLAECNALRSSFESDCEQGIWIRVSFPDTVWQTSIDLARRYGPMLGMRTLDSLHVACALELKAERFWTFDERQARLAEAAGLNTKP
jgi:predicted nucleic acid-binding protein